MTPQEASGLLGVDVDATISDIHHAYLRRARETHPDHFVGGSDAQLRAAHEDFVRVRDARETLLALKPVIPVHVEPLDPMDRTVRRRRGIGQSVLILIALAIVLVVVVSMQDAFRTTTYDYVPIQTFTPQSP